MTTTDDIIALAAQAAPTERSAADLVLFTRAVTRGMNSDVLRALRALRPGSLPDSPSWRAWLTATAATATATVGASVASGASDADGAGHATALTARFAICAAATALANEAPAPAASTPPDDYLAAAAAVAAGTAAAALVEGGLADAGGWSVPAVAAVIGAGVAAGIMLRLPEAMLRHTLGICATQAAGVLVATGTSAGPLQAGKAAFNAVEAAHLARLGFTSSRDPLDGRRGLFALFNR
jgi:2-methylcitrate dehydratase MmgE/PrpD-like protein